MRNSGKTNEELQKDPNPTVRKLGRIYEGIDLILPQRKLNEKYRGLSKIIWLRKKELDALGNALVDIPDLTYDDETSREVWKLSEPTGEKY